MRLLVFVLGLSSALCAQELRSNYTKFEYRIAMRDGKRLYTAVYAPKDQSQKYPFLMQRTPYSCGPYGVDNYPSQISPGEAFVKEGYIFVCQDVRGRYESEGTFIEMTPHGGAVSESTDTYDTIDWLLKNVRSNNGKAGIVGISVTAGVGGW